MVHIPKLSKAEQARIEKNKRAVEAFEKRVSDTPEVGVGSTSTSVEGAKHLTLTYAQQNERKGFASGNRLSLSPAHIQTDQYGRVRLVILTPDEYAAWSEGRYCALCWVLQKEPENPDWVVSSSIQPCDPMRGAACSFPRGREARERILPFRVISTTDAVMRGVG